MANHRNVRQFLPSVFQTDKIKNFMNSTTETLFDKKNADDTPYFIGQTTGGLFNPLKDFYAEEVRKIREDYQMDPTLIVRDLDSREVVSTHFYEDILNDLMNNGSYTNDHRRLFQNTSYSYAPPIDVDMFINFTNYYWYPEGGLAFEINADYEDIVGRIEFQADVRNSSEAIWLTNGHHVILNNDVEYIVEGVGRSINLIEFSLDDNLPKRIDRVQDVREEIEDITERFPAEYITMERGAQDENPWSRNNAWYHRDVINLSVGDRSLRAERGRQAERPIICFDKGLELYNYSRKPFEYVRLFGESLDTAIDGIIVRSEDLVIQDDDPNVYQFDGVEFNVYKTATDGDKVTVMDGNLKANEYAWSEDDEQWKELQLKTRPTQAPLFNLYDSQLEAEATLINDPYRYPDSNFEGNKIFSYETDEQDGLLDNILDLQIVYKSFQESSDITFRNFMEDHYYYKINDEEVTIPNFYYRTHNEDHVEPNNVYKFTIHKDDHHDNGIIYVNNDKMPNIILKGGAQYRFDYSDTTTTPRGWKNEYTAIRVLNSSGQSVVSATHGDNSVNIRTQIFEYDSENEDNNHYTYTDGTNEGRIIIVDDLVPESYFGDSWEERYDDDVVIKQRKAFFDDDTSNNYFEFEYIPKNDNFHVELNGDIIRKDEDFTYEDGEIKLISDDFERGDYIEVTYETFERIHETNDSIQVMHKAMTNNPFNEDVIDFAFSEMFNHFRSIIQNQLYIEGSSLSENNYRDTLKDGAKGDVVLKHENPMLPLSFITDSDKTNIINAIRFAMNSYVSFKNILILKTEEMMNENEFNTETVKDNFDEILAIMNAGKSSNNVFSKTNMFATYRRFSNVFVNDDNEFSEYIDLSVPENALYIYTDKGIMLNDIDYRIDSDEMTLESKLEPLTFDKDDINEIRYYEGMEPSFCPSTPAKFGLEQPTEPRIVKDDTFKRDRWFIIGHDGSMNLAYSTTEEIENDELDARDLMLLEFEKRIFNGIDSDFKSSGVSAFDYNDVREGAFRESQYSREQFNNTEFAFFHIWSYNNNVNYNENSQYDPDNAFTFNYAGMVDDFGNELPGHWKGIYMFYYDTFRPHTAPWEMLGFSIKPSWWDDEYGTDYSSNNEDLWYDLEEGIIRQGVRKNDELFAYLNTDNIYRREGLSNYIPVDENGDLKNPIEIGITEEPPFRTIRQPWQFGDLAPVEQAWKRSSLYSFVKQMTYFILSPLDYVNKSWDTTLTYDEMAPVANKPRDYRIHSIREDRFVPGITQWIHDKLVEENESNTEIMINAYQGTDIVLAHKIGGYIDSGNLRVITESSSPRSGDGTSAIPEEDVNVVIHESKNISSEIYSGVVIERIDPDMENINFEKGVIYSLGDVVFNTEDNNYYKNSKSMFTIPEWDSSTNYMQGREVRFGNKAYVCVQDHLMQSENPEEATDFWKLREFTDSDWKILKEKPEPRRTHFKVYGYDPYNSTFTINPAMRSGRKKTLRSFTNKSRQISVKRWEPNESYQRGEYRRLESGQIFRALESHTAGTDFNNQQWNRIREIPFENLAEVDVTIQGEKDMIEEVPYGTIFRTEKEVANFLLAYGRYLESRGWIFDERDRTRNEYNNWELSVKEFIQWAYENKAKGSVIAVSPASMKVKFKAEHGVPSVSRDFDRNMVTLLDNRSRIIDPQDAEILRLNNEFTIEYERPIYYARLNVREFEHAIVFNNRTIFNEVMYEPIFSIRKERLLINSRKSQDWDGKLKAEGFIISNNKLLPNFETSISDLKTIADMDDISTQDILNVLKYHNLGYEQRDYLENIELDDKAQINFYSGFINQKGTNEAFQRLLRSDLLEADENMTINEEWAFKEKDFGAVMNNQTIEFFLDRNDYVSSPQLLFMEYKREFEDKINPNIYINKDDKDKWIMSPTRFADDDNLWSEVRLSDVKKMPTAGYVRFSDAQFRAFELKNLNDNIQMSNRNVESGSIAWVAKDTREEYGFNVYVAQEDNNIEILDIISHGRDETSSMIVQAENVSENDVYGFYDLGYEYTFRMRKFDQLGEGFYVMLPFNRETFVVFEDDIEVEDLNNAQFITWKSTRINKYYNEIFNDVYDTIDTFIQKNNLEVFEGLKIYVDDARGDMSYKETVLNSDPKEYWTFDHYEEGEFIGEMESSNMIPDDEQSIDKDVQGLLLNSSGVSGESNYEPEDGVWPDAIWSSFGIEENINDKSLKFWVKNTGDLSYQFNQAVSTTIGGFILADIENGDVYTTQLMIDPPAVGDDWVYKIVYMKNAIIEQEQEVTLEEGFNQIVLTQYTDTEELEIIPYINGSKKDSMKTAITPTNDNDYHLYVITGDTGEEESHMPIIDQMAIYDRVLTLSEIQEQYKAGSEGIFADNDASEWAVYYYDGSQWVVDYKEEKVIDADLFRKIVIYDRHDTSTITNLNIHDPIKGYFAGSQIDHVDYIINYDPARYNVDTDKHSVWTDEKIGTLWLDTSKLRYLEYENFEVETRNNLWGSLFPGSEVVIYEWVKSYDNPEEQDDVDSIKDVEKYVTGVEYDTLTDEFVTTYYYWVKNNTEVDETLDRNISAVNIANSIRYPENNGVGYVRFLTNEVMSIVDTNNDIVESDVILQVNYRLEHDDSQKHTQWTLLSENSLDIPEYLFDKMVDSLLGYTAPKDDYPQGAPVPDPNLSQFNRFGNEIIPRQTWFRDPIRARRIFFEVINDALRQINVWDTNLFWEEEVEDVKRDTDVYGLVDWVGEDFDTDTIVRFLVDDRNLIVLEPLQDGDYVKVEESEGRMPSVEEEGSTIYRYHQDIDSYEKVFEERAALSFKESFYTRELTPEENVELRRIFEIIFDYLFIGENAQLKQDVFFALVRQVYNDHPSNDWVYPTTFISIDQTTNSLVPRRLFQIDREDDLVSYVNEAKPFHSKLRTINRTHTREPENVNLFVTDFDKPPFIVPEDRSLINLQEYVIERIRYRPEFYYQQKVQNSNPVEFWTLNRFENDSYDFVGELKNTVLEYKDGNVSQEDGISSGQKICINGSEVVYEAELEDTIGRNSTSIEYWFNRPEMVEFENDEEGDEVLFSSVKYERENTTDLHIELVAKYHEPEDEEDHNATYHVRFRLNNNITDYDIEISESITNIIVNYNINGVIIYVNGSPVVTENDNYSSVAGSKPSLQFGYKGENHKACFDFIAFYNRVLTSNEALIHRNGGDETRAENEFELQEIHDMSSLEVYIEDVKVPSEDYTITNNVLRFSEPVPLPLPENHYANITVRSNNVSHREIMDGYDKVRGYLSVNQSDMEEWQRTVNQKKTTISFDRVSLLPTFTLERLYETYKEIQNSDTPLEDFSKKSISNLGEKEQKYSQIDRIIVHYYFDELEDIVENSFVERVTSATKKNFQIGTKFDKDNIAVFVNEQYIDSRFYKLSESSEGEITVKMSSRVYRTETFAVRPKKEFEELILNSIEKRGMGVPYHSIDEINELNFVINNESYPVKLDDNGDLILDEDFVEEVEEAGRNAELVKGYSDFTGEGGDVREGGPFSNPANRGVPEERVAMNLGESMCFTFKNNLKIVPRGYETTKPLDIFETVAFDAEGGELQKTIDLNVPNEQVIVIVNDDEWVEDYHYELENTQIIFLRELKEGDKVTITDRYSAFDMYRDKQLFIHKNIQNGGFDGDMVLPDFLNDTEEFREFIVYDQLGKVFLFKSNEKDAIEIDEDFTIHDNELVLKDMSDKFKPANKNSGRILALYAQELDEDDKIVKSFVEFIHYREIDDKTIKNMTRGIFNTFYKNFDINKYIVKAYPIDIQKEMPMFTIVEPYIGIKGKESYPKYGHIMSGKD